MSAQDTISRLMAQRGTGVQALRMERSNSPVVLDSKHAKTGVISRQAADGRELRMGFHTAMARKHTPITRQCGRRRPSPAFG